MILYLSAVYVAYLRASELTVEAGYSKHRREDIVSFMPHTGLKNVAEAVASPIAERKAKVGPRFKTWTDQRSASSESGYWWHYGLHRPLSATVSSRHQRASRRTERK